MMLVTVQIGRVVISGHEVMLSGQRSAVSGQQKMTQKNFVLMAGG
jgi:hypothetical protein